MLPPWGPTFVHSLTPPQTVADAKMASNGIQTVLRFTRFTGCASDLLSDFIGYNLLDRVSVCLGGSVHSILIGRQGRLDWARREQSGTCYTIAHANSACFVSGSVKIKTAASRKNPEFQARAA